jgi:hypothetical protein
VPEFKCVIPFSQGVNEIIAWYQADPVRRSVDPAFNALCDRIIAAYSKAWPEQG